VTKEQKVVATLIPGDHGVGVELLEDLFSGLSGPAKQKCHLGHL